MKYHYQFVSAATVRIELIPEDRKETRLLDSLQTSDQENLQLKTLFSAALSTYAPNSAIKKLSFMNFPKVALCSYEKLAIPEKSTAL